MLQKRMVIRLAMYLRYPGVAQSLTRAHAALGVIDKAALQEVEELAVVALEDVAHVLNKLPKGISAVSYQAHIIVSMYTTHTLI